MLSPAAAYPLHRIAEVERLRERYSPSLVILCGDFNEDAASRIGGGGLHADLSAAPLRMVRLTDCKAEGTVCIPWRTG